MELVICCGQIIQQQSRQSALNSIHKQLSYCLLSEGGVKIKSRKSLQIVNSNVSPVPKVQ